jgi:hydrogenase nickel incorporation protein HypA/HybF
MNFWMADRIMHELSIAQDIIHIVEDKLSSMDAHNLQVRKIHFRVGKLRAIIPDNLRFSFEVLSRGSIVEKAYLEIEEIPLRCRCSDCRTRFQADYPHFYCPACGSGKVDILQGKELLVDSIEVDQLKENE